MNTFIPTGYLTVPTAIDRVVELMQGDDRSRLLTEDERATLRNWQDWKDQISRRQPEPVTPVRKAGDRGVFVARTPGEKHPHRPVEAEPQRPDVLPDRGLLEKEASSKELWQPAREILRQLVYDGRVPWEIITEDGNLISPPKHLSGGDQWYEALKSNRITFRPGILSVTGFPVIPRDALEAAFNTDGTVKEYLEERSTDATPNSQLGHQESAEPPVPEESEDEPTTIRDRAKGWLKTMESRRETEKISWAEAARQVAGNTDVDSATVEREARRIKQERDEDREKKRGN